MTSNEDDVKVFKSHKEVPPVKLKPVAGTAKLTETQLLTLSALNLEEDAMEKSQSYLLKCQQEAISLLNDRKILSVTLTEEDCKPIPVTTIISRTAPTVGDLMNTFFVLLASGFHEHKIKQILTQCRLVSLSDLVQYICLHEKEIPEDWKGVNAKDPIGLIGNYHKDPARALPLIKASVEEVSKEVDVCAFDNKSWILQHLESERDKIQSQFLESNLEAEKFEIKCIPTHGSNNLYADPSLGTELEEVSSDGSSELNIGDFMNMMELEGPATNTSIVVETVDLGLSKFTGILPSQLLQSLLGDTKCKYQYETYSFGFKATLLVDSVMYFMEKYGKTKLDAKEYVAFKTILNRFPKISKAQLPSIFRNIEMEHNASQLAHKLGSRGPSATERLQFFEHLRTNLEQDFKPISIVSQPLESCNLSYTCLLPLEDSSFKLRSQKLDEELMRSRMALPAFSMKEKIISVFRENNIVIVTGETGSGKSTQIPQFLLEDAFQQNSKFRLVCTEPRRISAMSLAARVSKEIGEESLSEQNNWVGYKVRSDSCVTSETKLIYCTTGILIRELTSDPQLRNYSHVLVDEVHERSLQSDFLILKLRKILETRPELKIGLMSATADAQKLQDYFHSFTDTVPIIHIPGKSFQVTEYYLEDVLRLTGKLNSS